MKNYTYRIAAPDDLERIWAKNIAKNPEEPGSAGGNSTSAITGTAMP